MMEALHTAVGGNLALSSRISSPIIRLAKHRSGYSITRAPLVNLVLVSKIAFDQVTFS